VAATAILRGQKPAKLRRMSEQRSPYDTAVLTGGRVLACVGADAHAPRIVREAARLAGALHSSWLALYVETPGLARRRPEDRERVLATLKLAESLGAETATLGAVDVASTVLEFARARGVTCVVMGRPTRPRWLRRLAGSVVDTLLSEASGINIELVAQPAAEDILADHTMAASVAGLGEVGSRPVRWSRYLWALALVGIATAIGWLLYPGMPGAGVVMLFLLAVILSGLHLGRGPATLTAICSGLAFNFFFTEPRLTLHIAHLADVLTFVALLAVGLVTAQLAAQARHQARVALQREERAVSLGSFTASLLGAQSERAIAEIGCDHISRVFSAEVDLLLRHDVGGAPLCSALGPGRALPEADASIAAWALERRQPAGAGTGTLPAEPLHYLPLGANDQVNAVLVLKPRVPRRVFLPEPRRALRSYAHQLALALERARWLRQARQAELAVQAEDLRNALLSGLSHDLRTPLASILGSASALLEHEEGLAAPGARELVSTIYDETLRMTRLASNLLEMARLTHGLGKPKREWIPLEELIGSVRNRLAITLRGRPVNVSLPPDLPLIQVDGLLFEQVLQNLLENAARYSPAGMPIDISAQTVDTAQGRVVRIAVMDRGPGIEDAAKDRVFDKFFRLDPEAAQSGTGLGLALCKAIVTLHGGGIGVQDRPGGGTIVWVTVPGGETLRGPEDESAVT